jgi:hypothetical protein
MAGQRTGWHRWPQVTRGRLALSRLHGLLRPTRSEWPAGTAHQDDWPGANRLAIADSFGSITITRAPAAAAR